VQKEITSMLNNAGIGTREGRRIFTALIEGGGNAIIPDGVLETTNVSRNNAALRKFADTSLCSMSRHFLKTRWILELVRQ